MQQNNLQFANLFARIGILKGERKSESDVDWKAIIAVFCCFFGNLGMFMAEAAGLMPKISIFPRYYL